MQTFEDKDGKTWGLHLTRPLIRAIHKDTGILITDLFRDDRALLDQICRDPMLSGTLLWLFCKEQADDREMSFEQFETATEGDVFGDAVRAVIDAVIDFFPPTSRTQMKEAMAKSEEISQMLVGNAMTMIDKELEELTQLNSTTSSKESSESTETAKH